MKQYPELVDIIDRGFQGADVLCNPQPCVCLEVHDGFWSFFFLNTSIFSMFSFLMFSRSIMLGGSGWFMWFKAVFQS